jgi:hypothetical protein
MTVKIKVFKTIINFLLEIIQIFYKEFLRRIKMNNYNKKILIYLMEI